MKPYPPGRRFSYHSSIIDSWVSYSYDPPEPPGDFENGIPLYPGADAEFHLESVKIGDLDILPNLSEEIRQMIQEEMENQHDGE